MGWKTHLVVYFSGREKISEIVKRIESLGFKCALGPVDFIYEWNSAPTKQQVLKLADNLCSVLRDSGAVFNIDTHN